MKRRGPGCALNSPGSLRSYCARAMILGPMVLGICAQYERMVNDDAQQGNWESLGYFLMDSIVGMLAAPSTAPVDCMDFNEG